MSLYDRVEKEFQQTEKKTDKPTFKPRSRYKNQQMEAVIKLVSKNEFGKKRQKEIEECIRAFNFTNQHINDFKKVFIDCELDDDGNATIE